MQPLGYLAARAIFSVLQLLEKRDRAFVRSESVALAAGVAHCWAIVFALIITNLTQAARLGTLSGTNDSSLPTWVGRIESMVVYSMSLWWITGMLIACIRALQVDEEMMGLPTDVCSAGTPGFLLALQSPLLKKMLSIAMLLSCAGLFLSVLLLTCASAWMWSVVTTCELSLFMVTFGFALPYAAVAIQHGWSGRAISKVNGSNDANDKERRLGVDSMGALAAASEAAGVGPQLCILLSLADVPSSPSVWSKLLHLSSSSAFLASLVGCALAPPMDTGMAVPPSAIEVVTAILLDFGTGMAITRYITGVSGWVYWMLIVAVCLIALLLCIEEVRDFVMELLDPIMPLQHSANKRLPCPWRECARILARVLALGCAVATVWRAPDPNGNDYHMQYSPPPAPAEWEQAYHDPYGYGADYHHGPDSYVGGPGFDYDHDHHWQSDTFNDRDWLMLRWREQAVALPKEEFLNVSMQALAVSADTLRVMVNDTNHNVVLLEFNGPVSTHEEQIRRRWEDALRTADGHLAQFVNLAFPAHLDTGLCYDMTMMPSEHEDGKTELQAYGSSTAAPLSEASSTEASSSEAASSETASSEEQVTTTTSTTATEFSWELWYKDRWNHVGDEDAQAAYKAICRAWRQSMNEDGDEEYREDSEDPYLSGMAESVDVADL